MTNAEYAALLAECNFKDPKAVSELVTASHTNVMFNDKVQERQIKSPVGAYNYFGGLFGSEEWPDGQGMDEVREFYADPYVPMTFQHFVRQAAICDPNLANECNRDRCQIPEGGRGTLPPQIFFKWGFETNRDCVANIRSIRQFRYWASKVIRSRELVDEQVMNMFYLMAGIQTTGNKITMQGETDADGNLQLAASTNPRNPLRGGLFNYMQEKFPAPTDLQKIVPLTARNLQGLARYWGQFQKGNEAAKGPRGENIYEFWHPDDWFDVEGIRDPDYMEKLKLTMPNKLFAGTLYQEGEREVVGNFAPRIMPWLPRFAATATGKIIPVDSHIGVDIEVGKEYVGSLSFENAPFGMAVIPSGKQGTIMSRPTLTQSGAGFPIMPISGNSPWIIRNDYDKECNKDLNQPFSQKDYELGFRMDDPQASVAFLFRRRIFQQSPINECDLAPIYEDAVGTTADCSFTQIGCDNRRAENDNIVTNPADPQFVECWSAACGNSLSAPFTYLVKVLRKANQPEYNSLNCACGATVSLFIYNSDTNVFVRELAGTILSDAMGFPESRYFVTTATALAANECIKGITCDAPLVLETNVVDAWDAEDGINVIMTGEESLAKGDAVDVKFYGESGELGSHKAIVAEVDADRGLVRLEGNDIGFKAQAFSGQTSIGVSKEVPADETTSAEESSAD